MLSCDVVAVLRLGLILLLAGLLASPALGQRRSRQTFEDQTTVTVVEVPVQVISQGEPLRDLTIADFEIQDNRKRQDIIGFEMVDLTKEVEIREVPIAARRHFLALFDMSSTDPKSMERAQVAAADLVLGGLHESDLGAVATYSETRGVQLILGFTSDKNQLRHAIESLGVVEPRGRVNDPLGLIIGDLDSDVSAEGDIDTGATAGGGFNAQAELGGGDLRTLQERDQRDQAKNRLLKLTESLKNVAAMMSAVEGRKHVLFLSEGFDSSVLVGNRGTSLEEQQRIMEDAQRAADGATWEVDNESRFGSGEAQSGMNQLLEEFRRADCSVQAIDIGGLVAGRSNANQDGLYLMAAETGGEMFTNYNNLGDAMEEMLQRTSVTYLLAFQPKDLKFDDKFHRLRVRVKDAPRGTRVVHRPGYFPPKPYDQQSPFEKRLKVAQSVMGSDRGLIDTSVYAGAFAVPGEKAYVPVLVEVTGSSLLDQHQGETVGAEIYAYALDEAGAVRDFFTRNLGLDIAAAGPALKDKGVKYWGHFDLDPGSYTVRVLVRNGLTGRTGLSISELEVAAAGGEVALLAPLFPEPMGTWVLGREDETEQRTGVAFPFLLNGEPFLPSARPVLGKGSVPVSLVSYNLGSGSLSAEAQLISDTGETFEGKLELSDPVAGTAGQVQVTGNLEAKKAKPGDYTLVVKLKNLANNKEETSTLPVRVAG